MAVDRKEIELLIRAREVGLSTFDSVASKVGNVTKAIQAEMAAADKGETSVKKLQVAMTSLAEAGTQLLNQQALIDLYKKMATQLEAAETKATAARQAQQDYAKTLDGAAEVTRKQTRELGSLTKAADGADAKVVSLTKAITGQAEALGRAGIPVNDLANAQERLVATAKQVGTAISATGQFIDGYDAKLKSLKETEEGLGSVNLFERQMEDAKRLFGASKNVDFWSASLLEAKVKSEDLAGVQTFQAEIDTANKLRASADYINFWTESLRQMEVEERRLGELNSFRKLGTDALASQGEITAFSAAARSAVEPTSQLARNLGAIIDPASAARATLSGLEEEIARVTAFVGEADKPIREYQDAINDLGRIQATILKQAGNVDAYKDQEAAVNRAAAAYEKAKTEVAALALAVEKADAPNAALAADLARAEVASRKAATAFESERLRLEALAKPLNAAGIATDELATASNRLKAASENTAGAVGKLDKASSGQNSAAGRFLGLRPYELTNLSYQINDVATQLGSGTPFFQVFAQQAGQIVQIFPGLITGFLKLAGPITGVVLVLGTLGLAIKRVVDFNNDLREFSKLLSVNADGAEYSAAGLAHMARALEDSGVKAKDAKAAIKEFVQQGLDPAQIIKFSLAAKNLAKVTGEDVPTAAKALAEGFTGGYAQVAALDDKLNFLTAAEREHIQAMFDAGQTAQARAAAFAILSAKYGEAADNARGPWSSAFRDLGNAFKGFLDWIGNSAPVQSMIDLLHDLGSAAKFAADHLPGAKGIGSVSAGGASADASGLTTAKGLKISPEDMTNILRTVYGEVGSAASVESMQAVVAVILNRMQATGASGSSIVKAPNQFEPWNTKAGQDKMMAATNEQLVKIMEQILPVLKGMDPTNGATYFYSPKGQAAASAKDGRSTTEGQGALSFAQPGNLTAQIGGQNYYKGQYSLSTDKQIKAGDDYIRQLKEEQARVEGISDAERVRLAGLNALREAQSRGASPEGQQEASRIASATEQFKVTTERVAQSAALAQEVASAISAASKTQEQSLGERMAAIIKQYDVYIAKVDEAKRKGNADIQGVPIDQIKEQLEGAKKALLDQEALKDFQTTMARLEKQRADGLTDINDRLATGAISSTQALDEIGALSAKLLPQMKQLAGDAGELVTNISQGKPSPDLIEFLRLMNQAGNKGTLEDQKAQLKVYEDTVKSLQTTQSAALSGVTDQLKDNSITSLEAFRQAQEITKQYGPQIEDWATNAEDFAKSISGAKPSAQLLAFIGEMQKAQAQASPTAAGGSPAAAKKIGDAGLSNDNTQLNQLLQQRNELVATYDQLVAAGAMTEADANAAKEAAYKETTPAIQEQIDKMYELIAALHESGDLVGPAYDAWLAKLTLVNTQTGYVDANLQKIKTTLETEFVQGAINLFGQLGDALGSVIDKTQTLGQGFRSALNAFLQFALGFLKKIAEMIIQQQIFNMIKNFDAASGGGGFWGSIAHAVVSAGVKHTGGLGGANGVNRFVPAAMFDGAPRYHNGYTPGTGMNLASGERAAIIKDDEEVLTSNNPRHIKNQVAGAAAKLGKVALKIVNTMDPGEFTSAGLSTAAGETAFFNLVSANAKKIKQVLG